MNLAKYVSVFNIGLQNTFVYRWNYFLRALFGLIPLAGTIFLWRAIFQEPGGKGFGGYDYGSMIYYYLLTILVSNLVTPTEDDWQIAADIREGQINSFLTKPLAARFLKNRTPEKNGAGERNQTKKGTQEVVPAIDKCVLQSDIKNADVFGQVHDGKSNPLNT